MAVDREKPRSASRGFPPRKIFSLGLLLLAFLSSPALARQQEKPAQPLKQDEACLACHGQPDMRSEKGKSIRIRPDRYASSIHGALGCADCHTSIKDFPHPAKVAKVRCETCHRGEVADAAKSIHAVLGEDPCTPCHGNVHELAAAARLLPGKCTECHQAEVRDLAESLHGQAAKAGDPDAPTCVSCHGPVHKIQASSEETSKVGKKNQPAACAQCHANPRFLSRHQIPVLHPVEQHLESVHGLAVSRGKNAAVCADCHGGHRILPARDAQSTVSHWNVAATCARCHSEIARQFDTGVHGEALKAGVRDAPDCTNCHGEHLILEPSNPASILNAANISTETCGRCHADARIAQLYDLPADRLPSYADSFHGLAVREGTLTAANCASCHGVHAIFRSSDPRSTVNPANLGKTCGQCHPGIGEKLAAGPVHVRITTGPAHPVVQWIRRFYLAIIALTLGFMLLHNLLDWFAKLGRHRRSESRPGSGLGDSQEHLMRMNIWFRIAHWGVMLSFPALVFTGFALKYPDSWWSTPFLLWGKQGAFRGRLHRTAAIVLLASTLYHLLHLALNRSDRRLLLAMLPKWKDATDLADVVRYNLNLRKEEPQFGKFNYAEKIEYWAFLWGTAVMAISGFLLWFNNFALRHFPKWVTDAATAVHWYEALLATFSILLWHFYMVIFDPLVYPMDTAWLDGKIPVDHYRQSRPGYLRALRRVGLVTPVSNEASPQVKSDSAINPETTEKPRSSFPEERS